MRVNNREAGWEMCILFVVYVRVFTQINVLNFKYDHCNQIPEKKSAVRVVE